MFFDSVVTSLRPCLPVSLPASALPYALSAPLPFQEVWKIELIFDRRAQVSPKWQRFFLHEATQIPRQIFNGKRRKKKG